MIEGYTNSYKGFITLILYMVFYMTTKMAYYKGLLKNNRRC